MRAMCFQRSLEPCVTLVLRATCSTRVRRARRPARGPRGPRIGLRHQDADVSLGSQELLRLRHVQPIPRT